MSQTLLPEGELVGPQRGFDNSAANANVIRATAFAKQRLDRIHARRYDNAKVVAFKEIFPLSPEKELNDLKKTAVGSNGAGKGASKGVGAGKGASEGVDSQSMPHFTQPEVDSSEEEGLFDPSASISGHSQANSRDRPPSPPTLFTKVVAMANTTPAAFVPKPVDLTDSKPAAKSSEMAMLRN